MRRGTFVFRQQGKTMPGDKRSIERRLRDERQAEAVKREIKTRFYALVTRTGVVVMATAHKDRSETVYEARQWGCDRFPPLLDISIERAEEFLAKRGCFIVMFEAQPVKLTGSNRLMFENEPIVSEKEAAIVKAMGGGPVKNKAQVMQVDMNFQRRIPKLRPIKAEKRA
jgi:hypothetical protein